MADTLAQMRTKALRYLEDYDLNSGGHWPSAEIDNFIVEQQQELWQHIHEVAPSVLSHTETEYTWTANTLKVDLSGASVLNTDDFEIEGVYLVPRNATVDYTNRPIRLRRVTYENINLHGWGVGNEMFYEDVSSTWAGASSGVRVWALQGIYLHLDPVPNVDTKLVIRWTRPWTAPATDGSQVVPSWFSRYEDIVLYGAILAAKGRSHEDDSYPARQYARKLQILDRKLRDREVTDTPLITFRGM